MQRKKQNFIEGAAILLVASIVVKLIGALFRIPLKNLIGGEGMGLFTVAYRLYSVMLIAATVGLPVALSKMVAEAATLGREREVRRIARVAAAVFIPVGAGAALLLFVCAAPLAQAIGSAAAYYPVAAIAPSVLFVAVISVFRGYYQGLSNMVPTAVSQVIEALGKLCVGLALAVLAMRSGASVETVAACAILGVTLGELAAALYLAGRVSCDRRHIHPAMLNDAVRPYGTLVRLLLTLAVPITISAAVMSLTDLIDMGIVMNRLQDVGLTQTHATEIYGVYSSMPVTLYNMPQTLITSLSVSIIPAISAARARQNFTKVTKTIGSALRISLLIALPSGAGFVALAGPILRLLFREDTVAATPMLQILGLAAPFVAVVALTNSILQALGRTDLPMISMLFGGLVKLAADYTLVGDADIQILGAPISTALCYLVIAVINLSQIYRLSHAMPPLSQVFLRPLAASVGMAACAFVVQLALCQWIGDKLATLAAVACAVAIYGLLLLGLRAVRREDALMLPKGEKIANILRL